MDSLQYLLALETFGIKFGLENIRTLSAALGNPQTKYASVLIAGTNGKGSVTAMVDCGLRAAGLRVGRYTSPHLIRLEERFAIDGQPVDPATLMSVLDEMRDLIDTLLASGALDAPPTFFEATTAAAFELFRRAGVQFAVLEVGLGGRLDATNCVEPVAAAITSIAFDHEQYLGNTLAAIAAEKAGVVRPGIPVIVGPLEPDARAVIVSICEAAGARLLEAHDGVKLASKSVDGRTSINVTTARADYGWVPLGLRGAHQIPNALVAVRLLEELGRDTPIGSRAITAALRDVRWPGRLQLLERPGGQRVLLDAAHNPAGASALAIYLKRECPEPIPFVFGAMRDKQATEMLRTLLPLASAFVLTAPANSRARSADELARLVTSLAPQCRIAIEPKPIAAVERAWSYGPLVCATGSIFLVGELLGSLGPDVTNL